MEISRSYTPVLPLGAASKDSGDDVLLLLIKIYADGALTPTIDQLSPGQLYFYQISSIRDSR